MFLGIRPVRTNYRTIDMLTHRCLFKNHIGRRACWILVSAQQPGLCQSAKCERLVAWSTQCRRGSHVNLPLPSSLPSSFPSPPLSPPSPSLSMHTLSWTWVALSRSFLRRPGLHVCCCCCYCYLFDKGFVFCFVFWFSFFLFFLLGLGICQFPHAG